MNFVGMGLVLASGWGLRLANAQNIAFNYPLCAELLVSRPSPNLLPAHRGEVIAEVNGAIAQLRFELNTKPKSVRPFPTWPDLDVEDSAEADRQVDAFIKHFDAMTLVEQKFYNMSNELDQLDLLAGQIGADQIGIDLEAYRLEGPAEIDGYLGRLAAEECRVDIDPALRVLRGSGTSRWAKWVEEALVTTRREIATWRRRDNIRCDLFYPVREGAILAERVSRYWRDEAAFSGAYYSGLTSWVSRDFREVFRAAPDLSRLGWDGREDQSEFLKRRRAGVSEEQIRYSGGILGLFGADGRAEAVRQIKSPEHAEYTMRFTLIPGWRDLPDHDRAPTLTLIVGAIDDRNQPRPPRRRRAVVSEGQTEAWSVGDAVPAR